ncbi:MAG: DinB family protein [Planctomycetes bacterium]|nr:DinB family protein [Planctomycetota bacterium]
MKSQDILKSTLKVTTMVTDSYVNDLTDIELLTRPGVGCNHIAWQLGHLISSNAQILNSLAPGSAPELPSGFAEQHSKATAGSDDPKGFLSKSEYQALLTRVNDAVVAVIDRMSESDLDAPGPEHFRSMFPTVGDVMVLLATHALMHAGQWVPVRRSLGKPVVI